MQSINWSQREKEHKDANMIQRMVTRNLVLRKEYRTRGENILDVRGEIHSENAFLISVAK